MISAVSDKASVVDHCVGDAGQGSVPAANRAAALCRLDDFVAEAVCRYARMRNVDRGPGAPAHVSQLSPHVRHRLVLQSELIEAALARHGFAKVEKFTQEVFWRSYWKGWLELRPSVWTRYRQALSEQLRAVEGGGFAAAYARACEGRTGIDCFDAWIAELCATGYLHDHARMWFASIWVHTLGLPWELGADLFLHHLLHGDPASNTLSWRWVVGLQTAGNRTAGVRSCYVNRTAGLRSCYEQNS